MNDLLRMSCSGATFVFFLLMTAACIGAVSSNLLRNASFGVAPPDTKNAQLYIYTHRDPTPKFVVDSVSLVSGVEPPPLPPPAPVPPVYDKLKNLYLTTDLVKDGQAKIAIVEPSSGVYANEARLIQRAIRDLTGVEVPVVKDDAPESAVPIKGNLIVLGNRSTNRAISDLYNLFYTFLDGRYPGAERNGTASVPYEVRTLHNQFGDGHNVVFVGGSDHGGVKAATDVFIRKLKGTGAKRGSLAVGWLAEIRLGKSVNVPQNIKDVEIWEASAGYGSTGYFGWNSLSKRMALYYMTGDPFHAREFLRLAFPDEQAKKEITQIDGERIENKDDPLAGPYHYNAHTMILLWDLIEESPVFSDEERLRVTNAFARQLNHRKDEGIYGLVEPPAAVGSRHGMWSAVSLYCLGRYFQKDYPNPIWQHCIDSAKLHFAPLHKHAWVSGEFDHLFWYNTGLEPILTFMILTGDREALRNGVLQTLLRGQEILVSGRQPDWALNSASIAFLHKAAYLTQDGRWLTYRNRTGVNLNTFRVGQSFTPEERLAPKLPTDLVSKWSLHPFPKPMWQARSTGLPFNESFQFGSFRSATDASGDFVLIKGYNAGVRNPYHSFALLELRIDGQTLLQGFGNQLLTRADGMVEPQVPMDSALKFCDVIGQTATAVAEVPRASYCYWRRTLAQRVGRYALIVDDLTFRNDSENMEVQIKWEGQGMRPTHRGDGSLRLQSSGTPSLPAGWQRVRSLDVACISQPAGADALIRLDNIGIMVLRATETGAWLEMPFRLAQKTTGEVFAEFVNYLDRGIVRMMLDGKPVSAEFDHYAPSVETRRVALGRHELTAGEHRLRVEVIGKHAGVEKCYVGLAGVVIRPDGAPPAAKSTAFEVHPSDVVQTTTSGGAATMEWVGAVKQGQHKVFFNVIGRTVAQASSLQNADKMSALPACAKVADNAAALALPEPALTVVGEHQKTTGDLVILAKDHLYGQRLTKAGVDATLVVADSPVNVDWDFAAGQLNVVAEKDTRLRLKLANVAAVSVDGKVEKLVMGEDGLAHLSLTAGRHVIENAKPSEPALNQMGERLAALLKDAKAQRERRAAASVAPTTLNAPPLATAWTANVGGGIVDLVAMSEPRPSGSGIVFAAEGKTVHVLTPDGKEIRKLQTDGNVRCLRWWQEHSLLLVGCADEKVIAFDRDGNRKWVFVSEMDPAVFRAAKDYWFKTAPGHEGIHGLHTGVFLNGKSQAFVGSACTLEILDESGKLAKRLPVFWGPGMKFNLVDAPDGSINLLIARWHNDGHALAIINNRTLDPNPRGFAGVPSGHSNIGGWDCMNRKHIFYEDVDGDGKKEVVSEINGFWNRVTVWAADGTPLYNAQFGPGQNTTPGANMRDLDIADLDGDGKKEILTATFNGLVVALNHRCEKLWARRLPSPPTVLKVAQSQIFVGCEDGTIVVLDGKGNVVRTGKVLGRPTHVEVISADNGALVLLGTDRGELKAMKVAP